MIFDFIALHFEPSLITFVVIKFILSLHLNLASYLFVTAYYMEFVQLQYHEVYYQPTN
jgi:hypothetical protein